jgi:hypothetical protein
MKPHLRIIGGRVIQFNSRDHAVRWVALLGAELLRECAVNSPKTFREWRERRSLWEGVVDCIVDIFHVPKRKRREPCAK